MDVDLPALFRTSLGRFADLEAANIASGVSERSLCARLAMVLEPLAHALGLADYRADVEYNRGRGDRVKTIIDERYEIVSVTCDLVLHARGLLEPDNLIAIEMKRFSHPRADKDSDRVRLRAMTGPARELRDYRTGMPVEHVSGYAFGYFVELRRNGAFLVEEYAGGRQVGEWTLGPQTGDAPRAVTRSPREVELVPDLFGVTADRMPDCGAR